MRVIVDQNIPCGLEAFSDAGEVVQLPGRDLRREDLEGCHVLIVRSITKVGPALLEGTGVKFVVHDPNFPIVGKKFVPQLGHAYAVQIELNPILRRVVVHVAGAKVLKGPLSHVGKSSTPVVLPIQPSAATGTPPLIVVPRKTAPTSIALCHSLLASMTRG